MAFTRFHDDPCRITKQNQEMTGFGRYMLNVPGNGDKPCYMEDPYIRMQKWGGNLMTNVVNVESDLFGMTRSAGRDYLKQNNFEVKAVKTERVSYPTCSAMTDQSRATHPAWMARDLEQVNWCFLPLDPQENTCIPFQNNLSSRILERDYYLAQAPSYINDGGFPSAEFAGADVTNNLCTNQNNCGTI
jgi:hypothetical protein